jgi:hypothetical protein
MKRVANWVGCILLVLPIIGCRHRIETFRESNVSGGELRSPFQDVFAHISEEHYLKINGKTYRDVMGDPPYYLEIPELHSLLFVTGNEDKGNVKFHIFCRETGQEAVINGGQLHFGFDIGSPRKPGEAYTDFVQKASSNEVTLVSQGSKARLIIVLNLSSKKVEHVQREMVNARY